MYKKKFLNSYFYKTKGFYIFFIPVAVPYKEIYRRVEVTGLKQTKVHGPILEKSRLFGLGWIGIEIQKPASPREDVVHIEGEFEVYEHQGPYKTLGKAYKNIMKERPKAKDYFNLYLDDPAKTNPEDCRTEVYLR